ncbi:hypothetical protein [Salsipaludibacter albus]|uniref:hypothetical protein n=1 Tax=Salsipaludibacter albus TaxID=2849650 RepID=UPI001EE41AFE|nr:hypothetical protein [Salsipaludibacter albus]MBY5162203.1 hypothetical protein [Salsipaludibacter albus]
MLRETGLHAALVMAAIVLVGTILDNVAVGAAVGLLAAALVTRQWPRRTLAEQPATDEVA